MFSGFWKQWDKELYKKVYIDVNSAASKLSENIVVVNIEKPELDSKSESLSQFRQRIISFLNTIAEKHDNNDIPEAIVFDISFSKDTIQLKALKTALEKVKDKKIDLYAVYNLRDYFENIPVYEVNEANQASILYDSVFERRLHSGFIVDDGLISYPSDIFLKGGFQDSIKIESIVKRVALDDSKTKFSHEFKELVTPLGPIEAIQNQTHDFIASNDNITGQFDLPLDVHEKFVLIGDLKHDYQHDIQTPRTYFLAWALNEKIGDKIAKQPLNNYIIIIGQTVFFSLLAVFLFALIFKYVKRLQTKPKTLAVLSFILSLVFFVLYGLLVFSFDKVVPIGLTIIGIAIALILAWRYALKFLVLGIIEGGDVYDVFISYSHNDYDWVKKNLQEPLSEFEKENGKKLKIFFDENSIGLGEHFTRKYMRGIADSKVIIPFISESYNKKNHCQNELNIGIKREVEKRMKMIIVTSDFSVVPEELTSVLLIDVKKKENYMEFLKDELNKALTPKPEVEN